MSILKTIFGGGDVVSKGIDLIDSFHTSKEEEIVAKTQAKVALMQAYAPFKVAQRLLALQFTATFLFCFVLTLTMALTGQAHNVEIVKDIINEFGLDWIMLTIVGGAYEGVISAKKGK